MFLSPRCRERRNTYPNTYPSSPVSRQLSHWCGWRNSSHNALECHILWSYDFAAVLKRDTPQCRGNAVMRGFLNPTYFFRKMRSEPTTNKYLYSVSETAQLLSVSRGTIYALMKSGQILAVYPTSQARISSDAIKRYVSKLEKDQRGLTAQLNEVLR